MKTQEINQITGNIAIDDRGSLKFINDFNFEGVKRFYQVQNHSKNFIRAWHGHVKEAKYVYVVKGSILFGAVPIPSTPYSDELGQNTTQEPKKYILSSDKPSILYVPPNHANGFMTLTDDAIVQFFSTSTLDESKGDDIRFAYDTWNIWNVEYR
jgi:dTDP-4-dehydrorhamnose 3,5-epimerase